MINPSPSHIDATIEKLGDGFCIRLAPVGLAPLRAQLIFTGEIEVMVLTTDQDGTPLKLRGVRNPPTISPLTGRIWLHRGQLSIRNSVYRRSPIRFVPPGQWFKNWRALFDGSLPLAADDFEWTQKDGQLCLHIAVCIPQGDGFDLWIWPDDRDALLSIVDEFLTT